MLAPDTYSLQLVEAPNVPDTELSEALRWRIQHLIEFPVEEAVIETFEMPHPAVPRGNPMVYAVVARRGDITGIVEEMRTQRLAIDAIDIPELCLRNLAIRMPQDAAGAAFLHFIDGCGYLTITRGGLLYMLRRIEAQHDGSQDMVAEIALQVQRSLDHYESQYDCQPVRQLVLGPGDGDAALAAALETNLGLSVSHFDPAQIFTAGDGELPELRGTAMLTVGAALRGAEPVQEVAA